MFDPAALGTLLIGLDRDRRDQHPAARRRATSTPRHDHQLGRSLAGRLRQLADALESRYPSGGSTELGGAA